MPKPELPEPDATLERWLLEAMSEGLQQWRPDLQYPESYSDMQGCARGILRRFKLEIKLVAQ